MLAVSATLAMELAMPRPNPEPVQQPHDKGQITLANLDDAFPETSDHKIGVELEFTTVDVKTGLPVPRFQEICDAMPDHLKPNLHGEFLKSQIELVTNPCDSLRSIRDELDELVSTAESIANQFGATLMWVGRHPSWQFDPQMVRDCARSRFNLQRLGARSEHLGTCALHVHIGVSRNDAVAVVDFMQRFVPLLVAVAANSPLDRGRDTGCRSGRAAIWSSAFHVCGLSGPFGDWVGFKERCKALRDAGRIHEPKDLYDFARPSRWGTVELRCCDLPPDLDHVIAIVALIQTLVVGIVLGRRPALVNRDFLRAELREAIVNGPDALLTNHNGELCSPFEWVRTVAYENQDIAEELGTDVALALAPTVLADNGSTRLLEDHVRRHTAASVHLSQSRHASRVKSKSVALAVAGTMLPLFVATLLYT